MAGEPGGEPLARKIRPAAERIADRDVALAVHRRARHPPVEAVRRIRALLVQRHLAPFVDPELVPADAAAARRGVDRMDRDDRLAPPAVSGDEPLPYLVALPCEAPT